MQWLGVVMTRQEAVTRVVRMSDGGRSEPNLARAGGVDARGRSRLDAPNWIALRWTLGTVYPIYAFIRI